MGAGFEPLERFRGRHEIGGERKNRNLLPRRALDVAQIAALLVAAEGERDAVGAGARGAADAVDILLRNIRQVEIDDVADAGDVDPARRDVGRDQHPHLPGLEAGDGALALCLALVAVDCAGCDAGRFELANDLVGAMLGAAEYQSALDVRLLEAERQKRGLLGLVDHRHALHDPVDRGRGRSHRDFGGVAEIAIGKLFDRLGHRRREEQRLALDRDEGDDPLERVDEAEIEHLVRFVQNQDFKLAERQSALVDEVEQPARRCNQHIEAARDGAQALRIGNAAEDDSDRKPHELAVGLGAGGDLRRKLARRRKHQHANVAGLGNVARRSKAVERGQHEGRGLAGAGLGDAEQIAAGQNRRDRLASGSASPANNPSRRAHREGASRAPGT